MDEQEENTISGAVLIADDHEVTRFGLTQLVKELGASRVIQAERFDTALEESAAKDLTLAIVDLGMPGLHSPDEIVKLRRARPDITLVVLSASTSRDDILKCLSAGVHGYFVKTESLAQLVERLKKVLHGEIYVPPIIAELQAEPDEPPFRRSPTHPVVENLTPRQRKVLHCLERGMTNKEIGRELNITVRTVKMHLASIYPALGVNNRTQAVAVVRDLESRGALSLKSDPQGPEGEEARE